MDIMFPKPTKKSKRPRRHFDPSVQKDYCEYCGATDLIDPPHHIRPKKMGGSRDVTINDPDNGITLCRRCHDRVHHRAGEYITPEELRLAKQKNAPDIPGHGFT